MIKICRKHTVEFGIGILPFHLFIPLFFHPIKICRGPMKCQVLYLPEWYRSTMELTDSGEMYGVGLPQVSVIKALLIIALHGIRDWIVWEFCSTTMVTLLVRPYIFCLGSLSLIFNSFWFFSSLCLSWPLVHLLAFISSICCCLSLPSLHLVLTSIITACTLDPKLTDLYQLLNPTQSAPILPFNCCYFPSWQLRKDHVVCIHTACRNISHMIDIK